MGVSWAERIVECPAEAMLGTVDILIDDGHVVSVRREKFIAPIDVMIEHLETKHLWSRERILEWLSGLK